jgi:phenylacetate-CoA ligase
LRKIGPFAGRGDNMVKLRGINVWPEAVGAIALAVDGVEPDYFVRAVRVDGRDELVVSVASAVPDADVPGLVERVERQLKDRLGVKIGVAIVRPGELDDSTEIRTLPKPKRFRDERA